ncbi:hypothetical protein BXZ70DRAFT_494037 [Cristinia sonorae]|uniref:Uncharacterized protein n=1 Tax=Cristinia sonorae TaxID=1940300 RepID=A0A8K0UGE4_9AGAR|nr:hypothetical protein BXZ70DRAFT_494037 [Cristinia sonorae]
MPLFLKCGICPLTGPCETEERERSPTEQLQTVRIEDDHVLITRRQTRPELRVQIHSDDTLRDDDAGVDELRVVQPARPKSPIPTSKLVTPPESPRLDDDDANSENIVKIDGLCYDLSDTNGSISTLIDVLYLSETHAIEHVRQRAINSLEQGISYEGGAATTFLRLDQPPAGKLYQRRTIFSYLHHVSISTYKLESSTRKAIYQCFQGASWN